MTTLDHLARRPHLIEPQDGLLIVEPLMVVPVADRVEGAPSRFVRLSPRTVGSRAA